MARILKARPDEQCDNGADDDEDGLTDCDDPDCEVDAACAPPVEACSDGVDNDGDGLADCEDSDCAALLVCQPPERADDGCGCRARPGGNPALPLWPLVIAGLVALRRRRRY